MSRSPRFDERSRREELMDDPGVGEEEMRIALRELEVINRLLGGYKPSIQGVRSLLRSGERRMTLLDVGCGGGDVSRALLRWATSKNLDLRITAIDLLPSVLAHARQATPAGREGLEFRLADILEVDDTERFDVVHSSLLLHHLPVERAGEALRKMYDLSRLGVVANDLHRHPLAYYSILGLTRLISRSRLIRSDAPISVLRGFRREELERLAIDANLPRPEVRWHWGFRWQVVIRR